MTALPSHLIEVSRILIGKTAAVHHGYITAGVIPLGSHPVIPNTIGAEGQWNTIDLADGAHWEGTDPGLIDVLAIKAVRLDILIAITCDDGEADGNNREFRLSWRAAEDDSHNKLNHQSHAESQIAGVRQQSNVLVPVRNGKFQTHFLRLYNSGVADFSAGHISRVAEVYY